MSNLLNPIANIITSETTYLNGALFAAFLAFAATGEWVAERAGTINISIEAMLLNGAFAALLGYHYSGSIIIGLITAVLGAMLVAGIQAEMSHRLFADQFVVGLTLNILVLGLSGFLNNQISPRATLAGRWDVPLLSEIPLVGTALFAQRWPFYLLYPLIPFSWWLVHRSRWGLEARSVGENPHAADLTGINVNKRRRQAIYYAGFTCGLGGAFILFAHVGRFENTIIGGRGFIALAAVIFGGWTLRGSILGCTIFAAALSFRLSIQGLGYNLNSELLQSLPFLLTIVVMAVFAKRVRAPAGLAQPYIRHIK